MAIDTAAKRRSAAGTGCVALIPGVTPDAAKPAAWRRQAAWGYSGIEAGEAVIETGHVYELTGKLSTFNIEGTL